MKIGIMGGGIFGVTAAIKLAEKGFAVDLFEKNDDILKSASGINQFRLHRGYHYPRSSETIVSCSESAPVFEREFPEAIISGLDHYYCIAKKGSFVSGEQFKNVCKEHNLPFEETTLDLMNSDSLDLTIKGHETLIDINKLKDICSRRLKENKVSLFFNKKAVKEDLKNYDFVVIATYASINPVLDLVGISKEKKQYQFELCEKPVVRLSDSFRNKSIVVMDGPFMCVDPFGDTGLYLMGNVVHAIHATNIGEVPIIGKKFWPLIDNGVIENPSITNFDKFIESGKRFIPELEKAEHIGSMYTIRTVLPYNDDTDKRPTTVEVMNDKIIVVFSGKIGTCVQAANDVIAAIEKEKKDREL